MSECYCLTCLWFGMEEDLIEDAIFSVCPNCYSLDIIFLID
jgi:Zn finger protein HypA/HybF involved in hydrogenase expression